VSFLQLAADRLPIIAIPANLGPVHSEGSSQFDLGAKSGQNSPRNHPSKPQARVFACDSVRAAGSRLQSRDFRERYPVGKYLHEKRAGKSRRRKFLLFHFRFAALKSRDSCNPLHIAVRSQIKMPWASNKILTTAP